MKNIIFDLGGVVLDWSPKKIEKEFKGDLNLPQKLFQNHFFQDYWIEFDRGMVTEEQIILQMSAFSGYSETQCRELVEFIKHSLTDIPETVALIEQLANLQYKLYCLSNMSVEFYDYLKRRKVFQYFDGQIISGLVKQVKPDEAIYHTLLDTYGLRAEESLFIDDLKANIETASALGFHTVLFQDRAKGYQKIHSLLKLKP